MIKNGLIFFGLGVLDRPEQPKFRPILFHNAVLESAHRRIEDDEDVEILLPGLHVYGAKRSEIVVSYRDQSIHFIGYGTKRRLRRIETKDYEWLNQHWIDEMIEIYGNKILTKAGIPHTV